MSSQSPPTAMMKRSPAAESESPPMAMMAPPPTVSEPLSSDSFDAIDKILSKLKLGNIAFNAPGSIGLYDTAVIELKLGLEKTADELKQMIESEGVREGAQIRVADRMEARLSGPNFAVTAITPEIQAVSRSDITEWKWEVKPKFEGRQFLHLTLSALISVDNETTPRVIRTFDKLIEVKVSWLQRIVSFFTKNWQWLWAAILVPVAGWTWNKWKKTNKASANISQSNK